jgi:magnesium chelatase accessory protein
LADLPLLRPKLHLVVGSQDRTIPPSDAARIAKLVPGALVTTLPGLGHLAHEEDPAAVAALIRRLASPA